MSGAFSAAGGKTRPWYNRFRKIPEADASGIFITAVQPFKSVPLQRPFWLLCHAKPKHRSRGCFLIFKSAAGIFPQFQNQDKRAKTAQPDFSVKRRRSLSFFRKISAFSADVFCIGQRPPSPAGSCRYFLFLPSHTVQTPRCRGILLKYAQVSFALPAHRQTPFFRPHAPF